MDTKFVSMFLLCVLAACQRTDVIQGSPKAGDNLNLPQIMWCSRDCADLEQAYRDSGKALESDQQLEGFAGVIDGRAVIYTLPPRYVDDQATLTLEHEVLHVAPSDYHQPHQPHQKGPMQ